MNTKELKEELNKLKLPSYYFQINEKRLNWIALYIYQVDDLWTVFFAERGIKEDVKYFESEHEACIYFLAEAKKMEGSDPIFGDAPIR